MATLEIVRPGILTTVQDLGRPGWGAFGVPPSGAMDAFAARAANQLVGNAPGAAGLELTGAGAALAVDEERIIAVGGADLDGRISSDGVSRPLPPWQAVVLGPGQTLRFVQRRRGGRAVLAIAGGLQVDAVFGSAATDVTNQLGGWFARPLRTGDRLPIGPAPARSARVLSAAAIEAAYADRFQLRFVPTPGISAALLAWMQETSFTVTPQSNRVGFRLRADSAAPLSGDATGTRVSEPLASGTIQLPPDGQPILLMADRQTIGGYPIAGHFIAADFSRAAQLWPGDRVRFVAVQPAEALCLLRQQAILLEH